ncbi:MAG: hypothetical protein Q9202_006627 [Teloschistes flavicans]
MPPAGANTHDPPYLHPDDKDRIDRIPLGFNDPYNAARDSYILEVMTADVIEEYNALDETTQWGIFTDFNCTRWNFVHESVPKLLEGWAASAVEDVSSSYLTAREKASKEYLFSRRKKHVEDYQSRYCLKVLRGPYGDGGLLGYLTSLPQERCPRLPFRASIMPEGAE